MKTDETSVVAQMGKAQSREKRHLEKLPKYMQKRTAVQNIGRKSSQLVRQCELAR